MSFEALYGTPPPALAVAPEGAVQVSPLIVGSGELEGLADGSLGRMVVAAPPGTLERRYVLAHALRALAAGGELVALAPKDRGGARLAKELEGFGCAVSEGARRHHRICQTRAPAAAVGLAEAMTAGGLQIAPNLGLWSQPGVFSWDRVDPGSALLLNHLPAFSGAGADLGCGIGLLASAVLASPAVTRLTLMDIDQRAVAAARRNVADPRACVLHADVRASAEVLADLDFVIMNPPFHDGGREDRSLGQAFIAISAQALKRGGVCRLVANLGLPYEAALIAHFATVALIAQTGGYKVYEARK